MNKQYTINFVTGNKDKWTTAQKALQNYPIKLIQKNIETPEIQSMDVEEIAIYSAQYAAKKLGKTVIKTDCGYYITSLNGFPGPFIKYFNQSITAKDILLLMENKENREVIIRECLAYATPDTEPIAFVSEDICQLATKEEGEGSPIDQLLICEGFDKPQAACDYDKIVEHWSTQLSHLHKFAKFLCE